MSVNSKMTAIADAIRAKTGGTGLLTLDDMAQDIAAIDTSENLDEVLDEQDSIIGQIQAALEGKAAASVETCTVTLNLTDASYTSPTGATLLLDDGSIVDTIMFDKGGTYTYTLPKPCLAYFQNFNSISGNYEGTYHNYVYVVRGDVTVNGKYYADSGPA